jgi:hypothetical protein
MATKSNATLNGLESGALNDKFILAELTSTTVALPL